MSLEALPAELIRSRASWIDALNVGDLDAYADLVSSAVVWFPPSGAPLKGRAEFRRWLAPFLDEYEYEFSVEAIRFRVVDHLALEEGRFHSRMTRRPRGESMVHEGRMLVFWLLEDDAKWRIERYVDIGSEG